MKKPGKLVMPLVVSSLIFSCSTVQDLNQVNNSTTLKQINKADNNIIKSTIIKGKVEFPQGFKIKATLEEIAPYGTVSLIYPHDHPSNPNQTIATGLTNNNGSFIITPSNSFNPQSGNIFVLEVIKRIGGFGNSLISLRTFIKWTGNSWASMTTPGIIINTKTTALAIIADKNNLSSDSTIGKINIVNGTSIPNITNPITGPGTIQRIVYQSNSNNHIYTRDLDSLEPPVKISTSSTNNSSQSFSFDGEKVVYIGVNNNINSIFISNADGTGTPVNVSKLLNVSTSSNSNPSLSKDKSKVVFATQSPSDGIYVANTDGTGNPIKVNQNYNIPSSVVYSISADGTKVAFLGYDSGTHLFVANTNGTGNPIKISSSFNSIQDDFAPVFTPDSSKVIFMGFQNSSTGLFLMETDGSGSALRVNPSDMQVSSYNSIPKFSEDGQKLSYLGHSLTKNKTVVCVYNFNGSSTTEIEPPYGSVVFNGSSGMRYIDMSNDGLKVSFYGSEMVGNSLKNYIYIMNSNGSGTPVRIYIPNLYMGFSPMFSPDSSKVLFGQMNSPVPLYVAKSDGSGIPFLITDKTSYFDDSNMYGFAGSGPQIILNNDKIIEVDEIVNQVLTDNYDPIKFIELKHGKYNSNHVN